MPSLRIITPTIKSIKANWEDKNMDVLKTKPNYSFSPER